MKKLLLFLGLTMLFSTGCMKYSYNIDLDDKGNMTVSEAQAVNYAMLESFGDVAKKEYNKGIAHDKKALEEKGYKVEDYDDGKFVGIKKIKNYNVSTYTVKDLPDGFKPVRDLPPVACQRGFFKNKCSFNLSYNISRLGIEQNENINSTENNVLSNADYIKAAGMSTVKGSEMAPAAELIIKIPHKATKHNAHKVLSDKEYMWNLTDDDLFEINLEYERINWLKILLVFFAGLSIVIAVVLYNRYKDTGW